MVVKSGMTMTLMEMKGMYEQVVIENGHRDNIEFVRGA